MTPGLSTRRAVAVIGAGMAGLTAARILTEHGHQVEVFDKSRGLGGRMSTRRHQELRFDHGARCFTAKSEPFRREVKRWLDAGVVFPWPPGEPNSYLPTPKMSSLGHSLAEGLQVQRQRRVVSLRRSSSWELHFADEGSQERPEPQKGFDIVLIALPAEQSTALLHTTTAVLAGQAAQVTSAPCWSVMIAFKTPLATELEASRSLGAPLAWAALESGKPGRPDRPCWVLQADAEFSRQHLDAEPNTVVEMLLEAFREKLSVTLPELLHSSAHRWRYAFPENPLGLGGLWDPELKLGAGGDWAGPDATVESAFLSGVALAKRVLALPTSVVSPRGDG